MTINKYINGMIKSGDTNMYTRMHGVHTNHVTRQNNGILIRQSKAVLYINVDIKAIQVSISNVNIDI